MSTELSPENEAYLDELVKRQYFADRGAVLNEAVDLLRRRRELLDALEAGVEQLRTGHTHRYDEDEESRFLADVEARARHRFGSE